MQAAAEPHEAQCGRRVGAAVTSMRGSGEVQETLEPELSLVLLSLTWLWAFMEDNRGREGQSSKDRPGIFGVGQGLDVAGALGVRMPALQEDPGGYSGSWWVLQALPAHNTEHGQVLGGGVMTLVLEFGALTSAANGEDGWEGPARNEAVIGTAQTKREADCRQWEEKGRKVQTRRHRGDGDSQRERG